MAKYNGYEWGWITGTGTREKPDGNATVLPENVIGVWGRIFRDGMEVPTYLESFLTEHVLSNTPSDSIWKRKPLATLLKLNMGEVYRLSMIDEKNLLHSTDIFSDPTPVKLKMRILQKWACKECSHTFYSELSENPSIIKRIMTIFSNMVVECESCQSKSVKKAGITKKPIIG